MAEQKDATRQGIVRMLLRVPLFYKILVANAVIVVLLMVACAVLADRVRPLDDGYFAILLGAGVVLSLLSNAVIVRVALSPLAELQRTAEHVREGDLDARTPSSQVADRDMERLTDTFNTMLDSSAMYRRRLRDIAARALNAQEEERKRIARELHDGIAQTLAAVRVRLRVARTAEDEAARLKALGRVGEELGEATEEVRRIAQGLRPPALDLLGLGPAIESHARAIAEASGLDVETRIDAIDERLTPEAELALYRILQEALSNAVRHADPRRVTILLSLHGRDVIATVTDDGRGFAVDTEMAGGGLGLYGMQERAAYVGGAVAIESSPGGGTTVRVTIPVVEAGSHV